MHECRKIVERYPADRLRPTRRFTDDESSGRKVDRGVMVQALLEGGWVAWRRGAARDRTQYLHQVLALGAKRPDGKGLRPPTT